MKMLDVHGMVIESMIIKAISAVVFTGIRWNVYRSFTFIYGAVEC